MSDNIKATNGCPKALGTGPCDCADGKWITGLLARMAATK